MDKLFPFVKDAAGGISWLAVLGFMILAILAIFVARKLPYIKGLV